MERKNIFWLLPLVFLTLLGGILTGWIRMGWSIELLPARHHGAIMVSSFLGTLICLERVVVLKKKWLLVLPLTCALSFVFFLFKMPFAAFTCISIASAGLTYFYIYIYHKHGENHNLVMLVGATAWLIGNLTLLITQNYFSVVIWWMAFFLLTIAGERLELTKFLPVNKTAKRIFYVLLAAFVLSAFSSFHGYGRYLGSAGLIGTGLWLFKYDMALKAVRKAGVHRYISVCLLCGYVWLIAAGIFFLPAGFSGFWYDGALHAFFLGFVFLMIFAHAPVIFPAVLKISFQPYHPTLYFWVILLTLSLISRELADFNAWYLLRKYSGLINGISILGFFVNFALVFTIKKRKQDHKDSLKNQGLFIH